MDDKIRLRLPVNILGNSEGWKNRATRKRRILIATLIGVFLCISLYMSVLRSNSEFHDTQISSHNHEAEVSVDDNTKELSSAATTFYEKYSSRLISKNTCVTPACYITASRIINNMNRNADPCDNFYEFACGGFRQKASIPEHQNVINAFSAVIDKTYKKLRVILHNPIMPEEPSHVKMSKNLYNSCLNEKIINERGHDPLLSILKELGGWPVLEHNWNENNFSWIEMKNRMAEIGITVSSFLSVDVDLDLKNNTKQTIYLDTPDFGILREFLLEGLNSSAVMSYYRFMVDIAVLLGASRSKAEKELLESLEFERQLANVSLPLTSRRDVTVLYDPMSIKELSHKYPTIPWKSFLNRLFRQKIVIDDDEIVNVAVPNCFALFEVLINETSQRTKANYGMWRIVSASAAYLSQDIRSRLIQFNEEFQSKKKNIPRWRECIGIVVQHLPLSVGSFYIKKYFNENAKITVVDMVDNIRYGFHKILQKIDWMDERTRQNALKRVAFMNTYVAYPNEFLDDEKINKIHDNLKQSVDNYFENVLNLNLFSMHDILSNFREPYNKENWKYHGKVTVVNAYYSLIENSIELPAAILQDVLFDSERPKYMNYGSIGFIIAHEIIHGVDDQGRLFDKNQNLNDWQDPSSKEKYLRKVQCIINQYSNYTESNTGLRLNGNLTLEENIADNGGMKNAYLTYNEWVAKNGEEQSLPGLDFTPQQLFWISAANVWCSKIRPERIEVVMSENSHSPDEFRVNGPISNLVEFANDFKCPPGTKMNPINKCTMCRYNRALQRSCGIIIFVQFLKYQHHKFDIVLAMSPQHARAQIALLNSSPVTTSP